MRNFIFIASAAAALAATTLIAPNRADAMAIGTPAGLLGAAETGAQAEPVRYVCRWNGYREVCWWRPDRHYRPYGYYRPHGFYQPYGFYRPHRFYGQRHWHRGYRW